MSKVIDIVNDLRNIEDLTAPAQVQLVSGTNIKTINGSSILGSGNIVLSASSDFASITGKPTTIAGYGITDAYTKTEIDAMVGSINSALDTINGQVI